MIALSWVCAVAIVLGALGVVVMRTPVHCGLCLILVMVATAGLYVTLHAPFLFAAQIIVYTAMVTMMFVVTMAVIGVDNREEIKDVIWAQRPLAIVATGALAAILIVFLTSSWLEEVSGFPSEPSPLVALSYSLFIEHYVAVEMVAALVLTAALATMAVREIRTHTSQGQQRDGGRHISLLGIASRQMEADSARRGGLSSAVGDSDESVNLPARRRRVLDDPREGVDLNGDMRRDAVRDAAHGDDVHGDMRDATHGDMPAPPAPARRGYQEET